jgi:hypothetical protein
MLDEEIDAGIELLKSALSGDDKGNAIEFVENLRKERDVYRALLENANKQMERFRDFSSYTYERSEPEDSSSDEI